MKNLQHRVVECSFGPIGCSGGRGVIPGFGPTMKDVDGRELEVRELYHKTHADANLNPHVDGDGFYWNFLEMEFDPRPRDPRIGMRLRNLVDPPTEKPRGGGSLETLASRTGREPSATLPPIKTLADADVRFTTLDGQPIRGSRSLSDGTVPVSGLVDTPAVQQVMMIAYNGTQSESRLITTT
jgi:hypothetical protein